MSSSNVLPLAIFSRASAGVIFGTAAFAASIICLTPSAILFLPFGLFVAWLDLLHVPRRHCEERKRRSNPVLRQTLDCFAALAMTDIVYLRRRPKDS